MAPRDLFDEAVRHHVAGRLLDAEAVYQRVLARDSGFAEAYNNLGVLVRARDTAEAHRLFQAAVAARPAYVDGLVNLGLSCIARREFDLAVDCFRDVLAVAPENGDAMSNLGAALRARGDVDEAFEVLCRAEQLMPESAPVHNNLGNVLLQRGRADEARAEYERALAIQPNYPEAINNLGTIYRGLREPETALAYFEQALDLRPGYLDALHNIALAMPPSAPGAERVEARLRAEVARHGDPAAALGALSVFLQESARFDEAREVARRSLEHDPRNPDAWITLGICAAEDGDPREAIRCYDHACEVEIGRAVGRWNRAIALLGLGEYDEGWREYEARWDLVVMLTDRRVFASPEWDGTSLDGRTILLYTEQGLGDAIQFARFARELKRRWRTRVIIECQVELVSLFQVCDWVDGVIARGTARPPFDTHLPLLSLPRVLGTRLDTLPTAPSFPAPSRPVSHVVQRIPGTLNVGLIWDGRAPNQALARRSIDLELFAPLAAVPGVKLHSLQIGDKSGQLERCSFRHAIQDLAPHIDDFVDTSAALASLDLVITIDTAAAHLAGSLGVPVWVLLIRNADWRWLIGRADSPWYPSARLFRQQTAGDWSPVIAEVTGALTGLVGKGRGPEGRCVPRPEAAALAAVASRQERDGQPRFTLSMPLAKLSDDDAFARYAAEIAGDGVDAETRAFFDESLQPGDVVIDVDAGWGFSALGAATAPTRPALVVATVDNMDDAAVIATGARSVRDIAPIRVHVHGGGAEEGVDDLLARYAPGGSRVMIRVQRTGAVPGVLAGASAALTNGRLEAVIWTLAQPLAHRLQSDDIAMQMLAMFGFAHFAMAADERGSVLVPVDAVPEARVVFSLRGSAAMSSDDSPGQHGVVAAAPRRDAKGLPMFGFDWQLGSTSGWGVYGMNLARRALASGTALPVPLAEPALAGLDADTVVLLEPSIAANARLRAGVAERSGQPMHVPFAMLRALGNELYAAPESAAIGATRNIGVVFFESTRLAPDAIARARRYDRIVAGSTWNADVLRSRGVGNVVTVLQGVDGSRFRRRGRRTKRRERFVIFSGGKLEYRKGQDIVIAAFREFRRRHPDALLMVAWHNHWPQTMREISIAGHTSGYPRMQSAERADIVSWLGANGVPLEAVIDAGLRANADMAAFIADADVALFTNRAEGGTNLVAMECLASGVPTILSANTGHLDLIGDDRCFPLLDQSAARATESFAGVDGWGESSVDEVVEVLERVYADPAEAERRGARAADWMTSLSWDHQIDALFDAVRDLL